MGNAKALIADRVRELLTESGISGAELARRLGATQSYVSRRVRGVVPWRADELYEIAGVLGISADEFLPTPDRAA